MATRIAGSMSLRRQLVGARAIPLRSPSSPLSMRSELLRRTQSVSKSQQYRFQGTTSMGQGQDTNPKGPKQMKPGPPPLSVSQFFLRSLLGGIRSVGNVFKGETLKQTFKTNPISLVLALVTYVLNAISDSDAVAWSCWCGLAANFPI